MSLYNILHGKTGLGEIILALLDEANPRTTQYVRLRDGFVEEHDGQIILRLHTRSGGGNRECYCDNEYDHDVGCIATGNDWMEAHPWYLRDEDDDFDNTYADFYFTLPADHELAAALADHASEHVDMGARWMATINALKAPTPTTQGDT